MQTRIFIVDDSPAIRTRLADMLRALPGVVVVGEAESAREAIAGILSTRPDSVLLDLNLTGSTGLPAGPGHRLRRPHQPRRDPVPPGEHPRRRGLFPRQVQRLRPRAAGDRGNCGSTPLTGRTTTDERHRHDHADREAHHHHG
jgi:hypothetical protein